MPLDAGTKLRPCKIVAAIGASGAGEVSPRPPTIRSLSSFGRDHPKDRSCDFKFEAHHSLVPMETFLRCAVTEPLAGPCVELLCDTIAVALRERCLAGALRQVLS